MELKDFISETLVELSTGVIEAARKLNEDERTKQVLINPLIRSQGGFVEGGQHHGVLGQVGDKPGIAVLAVDFNLAVTVTDEAGGKISVLAAIVGFGGSAAASTENKSISSVKFTIPMALPTIGYPNGVRS